MELSKSQTLRRRLLFGSLFISLITTICYLDSRFETTVPTSVLMTAFVLLAQWEVYRMLKNISSATKSYSGLILGIVVVLTITFVSLIQIRRADHYDGFQALLFLVIVAKVGDIAAYFVGSAIGKHKLAPTISPNKTWEGSIASVIAAVGLAVFLYSRGWAAGLTLEQAAGFGFVINVAAQIGDLAKSKLKRFCGVKDSGNYFSVMGGALDMIDSLIFSAPIYVGLRAVL